MKQEEGCNNSFCKAYLWIVPAKVEGAWSLPQGKLSLVQRFQRVFGELNLRGKIIPVANGKIDGDRIVFSIGNRHYSGQVNGNTMGGTVKAFGKTGDCEAKLIDNRLF